MPELGYNPVNRYLPPRERRNAPSADTTTTAAPAVGTDAGVVDKFFAWADKALTR